MINVAGAPNIAVRNTIDVKEDAVSLVKVDVHIGGLTVARK